MSDDHMNGLRKIAALHQLLHGMEEDLGMAGLTGSQKAVLYTIELLSDGGGEVPLQDIMQHELLADVSRPTFFRCLKFLLEEKFLTAHYYKGHSTYSIADRDE